jgi:hypothetical protein
LTGFRELRPEWTESIGRAIRALRADRSLRRVETARVLAEMLIGCLGFTLGLSLGPDEQLAVRRSEIERGFLDGLRGKEAKARREIEVLYKYYRQLFDVGELENPVMDDDLFAESTWKLLGLDASQVVAAYAITGALLGGVIDVSLGGASFLLGSAIGSLVGTGIGIRHAVARAGGDDLFDVTKNILSDKTQHRVGPLSDLNFPFILLDRAMLHYRSVLTRTHAHREMVRVRGERLGIVSALSLPQRNSLTRLFQKIRKSGGTVADTARNELHEELRKLLDKYAPEDESE